MNARIVRLGVAVLVMLALSLGTGCGPIKKMAIGKIGDSLAEGNSVFATDDDIELVGEALPFGLKLMESLLSQSPDHRGLLLAACEGFTSYAYAYVHFEAEVTKEEVDLDEGKAMAARARRLYLRARRYCLQGLERLYPGITDELAIDSQAALARVKVRDVPFLYWNAAALGLAISVSRGNAHMLARLPDVDALLARALALDEAWEEGALHEFTVVLAGAGGGFDVEAIPRLREHFDRALELSQGKRAGLFVTWAESVSVPTQNAVEFREMLRRALTIDPDEHEANRLMNLVSQRRADWLLGRVEDLFLDPEGMGQAGEGRR